MTRACGCPDGAHIVAVDEVKHAKWHERISPLPRGDEATLEAAYGRPSTPEHTYVDDQFDRERHR